MNKKIIGFVLAGLVFATPVFAATTVSLSPVSTRVAEGEHLNVDVFVNPEGAKNYTVSVKLKYPADTLEVESVALGDGWLEVKPAGVVDNDGGVLVTTAGYPGGFGAGTFFGTVTFRAKQTNEAVIRVVDGSLALDAQNRNVIGPLPVETRVAVSKSVAPTGAETEPVIAPEAEAPAEASVSGTVTAQGTPSPFLAAINQFVTFGTGNSVWGTVFFAVIGLIVCLIYIFFIRKKKSRGK